MRYQLVPAPFAEQTITYDDVHHRLMVGLYLVPLSATQYALVMALLRQRQRWVESHCRAPLLLSIPQLMHVARVSRPAYIKQHLFRASEQLRHHQIVIGCLIGRGYGIFDACEMPPPAADDAALVLASKRDSTNFPEL